MSIAGLDTNDAVEAAIGQARSLAELLDQRSPGERTSALLNKTKRVQRPLATAGNAPRFRPDELELASILMPPAKTNNSYPPFSVLAAAESQSLATILNPPGGSTTVPPGGADLTPPGGSSTAPPGGSSTTPPGGGNETPPIVPPPGANGTPPIVPPPGGNGTPPIVPPPGGNGTPPIVPPPGGDGTPPIVSPPGDDTHVRFPTDEPKEIIPVSPVPEPATWATMLLGFGLMGWRLRRRPGVRQTGARARRSELDLRRGA